jgi:signal transduction histidine kinase/CheY-like chemotaxis protein
MSIRKKYIIFFALIALSILFSQLLIRYAISTQEKDSTLINRSGRQRMLSQKICKLALIISNKSQKGIDAREDKEQLSKTIAVWSSSHNQLRNTPQSSNIFQKEVNKDKLLFAETQPFYDRIYKNSKTIITTSSLEEIQQSTQVILDIENNFLTLMDQIVNIYEINSNAKLATLKRVETYLGLFTFLVILLGVKLIFHPMVKSLMEKNLAFKNYNISLQEKNKELLVQKNRIKEQSLEMEEKNINLDFAKKEAEESLLAKAQFLSSMSHEIRTPMHVVLGITEILLTENLTPNQQGLLLTLTDSARNLLQIINDILDFDRIDSGKLTLGRIPFDLKKTITQSSNLANAAADKKGLKLVLDFDDQLPAQVKGDSHRINQLFNNLIGNAIKFTAEGGIIIRTEVVQQTNEEVILYFSVEDTGIGIAENKLSDIFNTFSQADTQATRNYGGTGLGLAITQKIVALMGGEIKVDSELGKGSKFYFTLTFDVAKNKVLGTTKPLTINERSLHQEGLQKILLVDDNQLDLAVGKKYLKYWNLKYDVAKNGQEAIDLVSQNDYSLVLMDLQMPIMDGFTAAENIRKIPENKYQIGKLPIIALTASTVVEAQQKAFDVGMNDFLMKPYKPEGLFNLLEKHLKLEYKILSK